MSKIGKKPIAIPENVEVTIQDNMVTVKGPKGELSYTAPAVVSLKQEENTLVTAISNQEDAPYWGLARTLIANMIEGVTNGYEKKLLVIGVGYSAKMQGTTLVLSLGLSHKVNYDVPEGITITTEQDPKGNAIVTIAGTNKQLVGEVAAKIRAYRKPEPYKGKGIRYIDEIVKLKAGKAAKK